MENFMMEISDSDVFGKIYICIDCNEEFAYIGSRVLKIYRCGLCHKKHLKKEWRKADKKWRKTKKGKEYINKQIKKQPTSKLGTTGISSHFSGDFKREERVVKREKKRLGLPHENK